MTSTLLWGSIGLCALMLHSRTPLKSGMEMRSLNFVVSESAPPTSFDPVDADYGNNLHASQMVHRTLLEVGSDNTLTSHVLKSFFYDPKTAEIRFVVSELARYSDGSHIAAADVEMTIKRMLLKRPAFPVLRHIRGVEQWVNASSPLAQPLEGMKVSGDTVTIQLHRHVNNPLFRFALPLFGVVKASCVNKQDNTLVKNCPASGQYEVRKNLEGSIQFSPHKFSTLDQKSSISIDYIGRSVDLAMLQGMSSGSYIIQAQEYSLGAGDITKLGEQGFSKIEQPNSRFSSFLINPKTKIFEQVSCRRLFAEAMRKNLSFTGSNIQTEFSLFSRILPGFMNKESLERSAIPVSTEEKKKCLSVFKGKSIRWSPGVSNNAKTFESALRVTAAELGLSLAVVEFDSPAKQFDAFVNNETDLLLGGSGFWAFDPVGDLQMMFTRNMHKPLTFVAGDEKLQEMLKGLEFLDNPKSKLEEINQYLYSESLMNVYGHSKRVYFVKGSEVSPKISIAITPPAPWQMFLHQVD